ncbi:Secondary metabolism regulator laeA [Beauveria bassiana]|nr:Secondary metabolism regulator laeA [Beauveria bassiana]
MKQAFPSRHDPKQKNSPDMVLREGYWKHGRFYGSWRRDLYLFPIDEEEMRRLDIFHKFFLLARRNNAFSYPTQHSNPNSVLDLGTGTSIWAIYVAEEILPKAHVTAVDLNRVQPARIPPNMITVQLNMEDDSWAPLPTDYDLVHMRLLLGSIHDTLWEAVYKNAFK